MSLQAKLRKLEQTARATWTCGLCRGHPLATWRVDLRPDPNGPGCIHVPRFLDPWCRGTITDDGLQCRQYGEPVREPLIIVHPTRGEP